MKDTILENIEIVKKEITKNKKLYEETMTQKYFANFLRYTKIEESLLDIKKILEEKDEIRSNTEMIDFLDIKMKENHKIIDLTEKLNEELETSDENISEELLDHFRKAGIDVDKMDEGVLGTLVGGLTGFFIGPSIGRLIARALGVTKGILFDMFNSKLVGTALGVAIMKSFSNKKERHSKK